MNWCSRHDLPTPISPVCVHVYVYVYVCALHDKQVCVCVHLMTYINIISLHSNQITRTGDNENGHDMQHVEEIASTSTNSSKVITTTLLYNFSRTPTDPTTKTNIRCHHTSSPLPQTRDKYHQWPSVISVLLVYRRDQYFSKPFKLSKFKSFKYKVRSVWVGLPRHHVHGFVIHKIRLHEKFLDKNLLPCNRLFMRPRNLCFFCSKWPF